MITNQVIKPISISKKVRFEVFKRDIFCCQYCGKTPPSTVLEIDHIIPVSKNGTNEIDNLVTSCFECNRGKSNNELSTLPESTINKVFLLKEKQEQYKEYQNLLASMHELLNIDVHKLNDVFTSYFPQKEFSDHFKNSVKIFIKKLGYESVYEALVKACSIVHYSGGSLNYFCGICWKRIKNPNNG